MLDETFPKPEVTVAQEIGDRHEQQDTFTYDIGKGYAVVCDGMGGHPGGKLCACIAAESAAMICEDMELIGPINVIPAKRPPPFGSGTTIVGVKWHQDKEVFWATLFSIGDSYAIVLNPNGEIIHTTPVEGYGNFLLEYWNGKQNKEVTSHELELEQGSTIILASDGLDPLMGNLPEHMRAKTFVRPRVSLDENALSFISRILSKEDLQSILKETVALGGGRADNATILIVNF